MKKNLKIKLAIALILLIVIGFFAGIAYSYREEIDKFLIGSSDLGTIENHINTIIGEYQNNTDISFLDYLERELQVGVRDNTNETYSFSMEEYEFTVNTNGIISRTLLADGTKVFANVQKMKEDIYNTLNNGDVVKTTSYYADLTGGGAIYDITNDNTNVDEMTKITLNNGLYAELRIINDTVDIKSLGAYGDGIRDDTVYFDKAYSLDVNNISFPMGEYIISHDIIIDKSVSLIGNNASLNKNINIQNCQNVGIYGLNISTISENATINLDNVQDINISNSTLRNTGGGSTIYLNNGSNVNITNNSIYNTSSNDTNSIDIHVSSNIVFKDNSVQIVGHNNVISTVGVNTIKITSNNFNIQNDDTSISSSNFDFKNTTNVDFSSNRITSESNGNILTTTNSENVRLNANNITYENINTTSLDASTYITIFQGNMNIESNNITISGDNINIPLVAFDISGNITSNTITTNTILDTLIKNSNTLENNRITINEKVNTILENTLSIRNNTITINNDIDNMFAYQGISLNDDLYITSNRVNNNYDELTNDNSHTVLVINNTNMNNKKIIFTDNTINNLNISNSSSLLYFNPNESEGQEVDIYNNKLSGYKGHSYFVKVGNTTNIYSNETTYYTVKFYDYDNILIKEEVVEEYTTAHAPTLKDRDNYEFIGWNVDFTRVTSDLEVTALYKEIPKTDNYYNVLEGANQTYDVNSSDYLTFVIDANPLELKEVYIDDYLVNSDNYVVSGIKTYITFTQDFSKNLSIKEHTLKVIFKDGYSETKFTVVKIEESKEEVRTYSYRVIDRGPITGGVYRAFDTNAESIIHDNEEETTDEKDKKEEDKKENDIDESKYTDENDEEEEDKRFTINDNLIYYGSLALICIGLGLLIVVRLKRIKDL